MRSVATQILISVCVVSALLAGMACSCNQTTFGEMDGPPIPLHPTFGDEIKCSLPLLTWKAGATNVTSYEVMLDSVSMAVLTGTDFSYPVTDPMSIGMHTWQVVAVNNFQRLESKEVNFEIIGLNNTTQLNPLTGSCIDTDTPTFTWDPAPDAIGYDIQISSDSTFATIDQTSSVGSATTYTADPLTNGQWFWRIVSHFDPCGDQLSDIWTLTVDDGLVVATNLPIPTPTPIIGTACTPPAFTWSGGTVSSPTSYEFQLASDSGFSTVLVGHTALTYAAYTLVGTEQALTPGTYYFRVRSYFYSCPGTFSAVESFVIDDPTVVTPDSAVQSGCAPLDPTVLTWTETGPASATFSIEISADSAGWTSPLFSDTAVAGLSIDPSVALPFGTYYWRVKSNNAACTNDWQQSSGTIAVTGTGPAIPTIVDLTCSTMDFEWLNVAGADYELEYSSTGSYATGFSTTFTPGTTSYVPVLTPGTWMWHIKATSGGCTSDWSADTMVDVIAQWSKGLGTAGADFVGFATINRAIITDSSGNLFVSGSINGTGAVGSAVNLGCGVMSGLGDTDMYVAKYSKSGTCIAAKLIGNTLANTGNRQIAVDPAGNVYLTGYFTGSIDFGDGAVAASGEDVFLVKLSPTLGLVWKKVWGTALNEEGSGVSLNTSGDMFVSFGYRVDSAGANIDLGCGVLPGATTGTPIYLGVAKLDTAGNCIWSKGIGSGTTGIGGGAAFTTRDVLATADGDVVVNAYFTYPGIDFGGGTLVPFDAGMSPPTYSFAVARYDGAAGAYEWANLYGPHATDTCCIGSTLMVNQMAEDSVGDIVLMGNYTIGVGSPPSSFLDFGTGPVPYLNGQDTFLAKIGPDASPRWAYGFGSTVGNIDRPGGISIGCDDSIYFTMAMYSGTMDFAGQGTLTSFGTLADTVISKFDPLGTVQYAEVYGVGGTNEIPFGGVAAGPDNLIYYAGTYSASSPDFCCGGLTPIGGNDIFIATRAK